MVAKEYKVNCQVHVFNYRMKLWATLYETAVYDCNLDNSETLIVSDHVADIMFNMFFK